MCVKPFDFDCKPTFLIWSVWHNRCGINVPFPVYSKEMARVYRMHNLVSATSHQLLKSCVQWSLQPIFLIMTLTMHTSKYSCTKCYILCNIQYLYLCNLSWVESVLWCHGVLWLVFSRALGSYKVVCHRRLQLSSPKHINVLVKLLPAFTWSTSIRFIILTFHLIS